MLPLSSLDHLLLLVASGLLFLLVTSRWPQARHPSEFHGHAVWRDPLLVGVLAASIVLWVWWPSRSIPVVHDEAAYLLQADLLARGHFAGPAPLVPELSEQAAILVSPVLAAKMMPGHALALLPGVALGLPWLGPVLLTALTAGLLFTLVRLLGGPGAGLLAVVLWLTAPGVLRWQPSYFSEVTTTALLLLGWLGAWRWWGSGRIAWLVACALSFSVLGITRPLTAVAQAVPIAILVVLRMKSTTRWRQLIPALLIGGLPLLLIPLQSRAVTGQWNRTPWSLYSEQYMPWDRPGFGLDERLPTRILPVDLAAGMSEFVVLHREHTRAALPAILKERVTALWRHQTSGWRIYLLPLLCLIGIAAHWRIGLLIGVTASLQIGVYLSYAHQPFWTIYYAELIPLFMALSALGVARIERFARAKENRPAVVAFGWSGVLLLLTLPTLMRQRKQHLGIAQPWIALDAALATTGEQARFVYIRYGAVHDPHQSLVRNRADGGAGKLQVIYEPTPAQDSMLQVRFPDRQAWLYDVESNTTRRLR